MKEFEAWKRVRVIGNLGAHRTLVFSHGFGTDQDCWGSLLPGLEGHYRLVLFNHAGAGGTKDSGWSPRAYRRLNSFANDLVALTDQLDLNDAVLVGHSAGAMIGMLAALERPERLSRLVLIGASACYRNDGNYEGGMGREDFTHLYRLILTDYQEWLRLFVPRMTGKPEGDPLHGYLTSMLQRLKPAEALAMATTVLESDYRDWLELVAQPTLLIHGREDPVVPHAAAAYLSSGIRNSRTVTLNATGHFGFTDTPAEVVAAIREFADADALPGS